MASFEIPAKSASTVRESETEGGALGKHFFATMNPMLHAEDSEGDRIVESCKGFCFDSSYKISIKYQDQPACTDYRVSHPPMSISGSREFREILLV
jgi:hypothetical protein